jgi:hypothetical protein
MSRSPEMFLVKFGFHPLQLISSVETEDRSDIQSGNA